MIRRLSNRMGGVLEQAFTKRLQKRRIHRPANINHPSVNLVSAWNEQCGIATYCAFLAEELKKVTVVNIVPLRKKFALSPYFLSLGFSAAHCSDVVHIQFEYGLFSSLRLGKRDLTAFASLPFYAGLSLGNRQVITTLHEPRKNITSNGRSGIAYTRLVDKLIFSVSDLIIVHTQESKSLLQRVYGVEEDKLRVVAHGSYEDPRFSDKEKAKAYLGLGDKTVVTIVGFVTAKKGHDLAIPLLPKLSRDVQLVIAGGPQNVQDEHYMAYLKNLAEQHGVSDRVTFTGYREDLTVILNASDIALLPYRYVTDSGVLHLLIAYRVPTLASDLAAFREAHGKYGCVDLFKSGDTDDLYSKLITLLLDSQHRTTLREKCDGMWNATRWSSIAQKHVELYREVLSKKA